jgi:hypothetical protein
MTKSIYETLINLSETPAAAAKVAGKGLSRFIPGVGLAAGGYDAYKRARVGDWKGAALSGTAGVASLIPGLGTAAAVGLTGAQAAADKARTGSYMPDENEIEAAGKPNQLYIKFNDDTGHTYTNVKQLPTDAQIAAKVKQDHPNKTVSNIVKGKF